MEPPLTMALVYNNPSRHSVPSETFTPDCRVGEELPETTSGVPPLEGVLNAYVVEPKVKPYQVFCDHEDAE